jgi:hypothetical protein
MSTGHLGRVMKSEWQKNTVNEMMSQCHSSIGLGLQHSSISFDGNLSNVM